MSQKSEQEPIFVQDLENPIELSTKVTSRVLQWLKKPSLNSVWNTFKSTVEFFTNGKESGASNNAIIEKPKKIKLEVDLKNGTVQKKSNEEASSNLRAKLKILTKKFSSQSNDYTTTQVSPNPTQPTHTANLINSLQSSRKDR